MNDKLHGQTFVNMFSFSIDLFVREVVNTKSSTRLILYKSNYPIASPTIDANFTADKFINYMNGRSSMIMYLTETNDLMITFFSNSMQFNMAPLKNIPLYTPFRISVVVQDKMFTVYLNSKEVFQRMVPGLISLPSTISGTQLFYSSPEWANNPKQTVFVQNFHVWGRAISYKELITAKPALALVDDFGLSPEVAAECLSASQALKNASDTIVSSVRNVLG